MVTREATLDAQGAKLGDSAVQIGTLAIVKQTDADQRPAGILQRGLILQHPQLSRLLAQRRSQTVIPRLRVDPQVLMRLDEARLAVAAGDAGAARLLTFVGYVDPLGARNDREQEITTGVKEGDEVLIRPPSAEANEFK
jgi:hypothetical protein